MPPARGRVHNNVFVNYQDPRQSASTKFRLSKIRRQSADPKKIPRICVCKRTSPHSAHLRAGLLQRLGRHRLSVTHSLSPVVSCGCSRRAHRDSPTVAQKAATPTATTENGKIAPTDRPAAALISVLASQPAPRSYFQSDCGPLAACPGSRVSGCSVFR